MWGEKKKESFIHFLLFLMSNEWGQWWALATAARLVHHTVTTCEIRLKTLPLDLCGKLAHAEQCSGDVRNKPTKKEIQTAQNMWLQVWRIKRHAQWLFASMREPLAVWLACDAVRLRSQTHGIYDLHFSDIHPVQRCWMLATSLQCLQSSVEIKDIH